MTIRPILFSAPMVRALLAGTKTQTRRIMKPQPPPDYPRLIGPAMMAPAVKDRDGNAEPGPDRWMVSTPDGEWGCPIPFAPGDLLCPAMPIPSLNRNYCADVNGRIWSRASDGSTWKLMKGSPTSKGYLSVTPAHEGRYRTRLVHRLVAEAFYGYEPNGLRQVRHLNGNRLDNAPENLDWGTPEDNWSDRHAHGRDIGERHHSSRLTKNQVDDIRASEVSQRALASRFGVSQSAIWAVKSGRFWQENPQPNNPNFSRWASRLTLEVTKVRVERLQDISGFDAIAEGAVLNPDGTWGFDGAPQWGVTAWGAFAALWDSINGKRDGASWAANPWVTAVTFTVHRCNVDQIGDRT